MAQHAPSYNHIDQVTYAEDWVRAFLRICDLIADRPVPPDPDSCEPCRQLVQLMRFVERASPFNSPLAILPTDLGRAVVKIYALRASNRADEHVCR